MIVSISSETKISLFCSSVSEKESSSGVETGSSITSETLLSIAISGSSVSIVSSVTDSSVFSVSKDFISDSLILNSSGKISAGSSGSKVT